jgi:uncharacterized protein (TIRG00374 family)
VREAADPLDPTAGEPAADLPHDDEDADAPHLEFSRRGVLLFAVFIVVAIAALYFFLPQLAGLEDTWKRIEEGSPGWLVIALLFTVGMFAGYVALFQGVFVRAGSRLHWRESYQICMAGLAATRLFSAGGAGGIVLTYWALRKAGMPRKETAARMVAFLVLLYAVYMATLLINGILMRTGVFDVSAPPGLTIVPAAIAGGIIVVFLLMALIPGDLERRFSSGSQEKFWGRMMRRLATVPATASVGTREAMAFVREPQRGSLALLGAIGFWAAQIGILWASFKAFGVEVPLAIVVQGFFVGMIANLIPLPGGVGGVDAGLLGAFALFGIHGIFSAILLYRVLAFWAPIPPGVVSFLQLRKTVHGWDQTRLDPERSTGAGDPMPGSAITS